MLVAAGGLCLPRPAAAFSTSGHRRWDRADETQWVPAGTQQISQRQSSNPDRNLSSHLFLFVSSVSFTWGAANPVTAESSARCCSVFLHAGRLQPAAAAPYGAAGLAAVRGAAARSRSQRLVPRARSACWLTGIVKAP